MLFPWHNTLIIIIEYFDQQGLLHWSFKWNFQFNYLNAWSIAKQIDPNLMEFMSIATGLLIEQNLSKWTSPYRNVYLQSQYTFCTFDQHFMKNRFASIINPPKMNLEMCVWMYCNHMHVYPWISCTSSTNIHTCLYSTTIAKLGASDYCWVFDSHRIPWWRCRMETFSALLALCARTSPVAGEFSAQSQWHRALKFSLICAWINGWVNNCEAGDLRRHHAHYDVIVMYM